MSDEDAFLAALVANPADDVCRLVFADWLEEREQYEKATYLRLVCRAVEEIGTPNEAAVVEQLFAASELLPWEWRNAAAGRFGLVLLSYPPDQKIGTIKCLRELWQWGLADAKAEAENIPNRLITWATFEDVGCVRMLLGYRDSVRLKIEHHDVGTLAKKPPPRLSYHRYDLTGSFSVFNSPWDRLYSLSDELAATLTLFVNKHADPDAPTQITCADGALGFLLCEDTPLTHVARRLTAARAEGDRLAAEHGLLLHLYPRPLPTGDL